MKELNGVMGMLAATIAIAIAQPTLAVKPAAAATGNNPTSVTSVRLDPTATGVDVVLQTQGNGKAQVFNVNNKDNSLTSYVFNARLANNQPFRQNNPAPGIAYIAVTPSGSNGVQIKVAGQGSTPVGQITRRDGQGIVLSVSGKGGMASQPGIMAQAMTTAQAATPVAPLAPAPLPASIPTVPGNQGSPVPPLMPRASAPPVGDMAVSEIDTSSGSIDLGSAERIPRLVLRDAPVREVLSLLARAAGVNLAFAEAPGSGPSAAAAPGAAGSGSGGPTISLDIENESVQDVFNYVLRIACVPAGGGGGAPGSGACASLEANRVGRTIFVGPKLPDDARNFVTRTLRLNQASAADASGFLTTQGAETQRAIEQVQIQTVGEGAAARIIETRTPTILNLKATEGNAPLILRGLAVSTNDRTNSLTLTGSPRKVAMATSLLTQLDVRKRQAAVSVKIIDVNLNGLDKFNTSFSFGVGNISVVDSQGAGIINFGSSTPGSVSDTALGTGNIFTNSATAGTSILPSNGKGGLAKALLGQLQAAITSQNAKVLTDPTLTIQEGQLSKVKLTEEVISNFKIETQAGSPPTTTITTEKAEAGLQVDVRIERIDDNGFITMQLNPTIKSPISTQTITLPNGGGSQTLTLLQSREVNTGLIRVRDGQTLLLTGVIQESDKSTVRKVPILGDLPILGALFRSTQRENLRKEVILMVTPRIMDDSDRSAFGYGFSPTPEAQDLIRKGGGAR
jgi:type IV pilus assembly protein PilQ